MPSSSAIIGRVAVKVLPDTSDFRRIAERELSAIERSLKDLKVGIDLDDGALAEKAKGARDKAQNALKDIKLKVNLDSEDSVRDGLRRIKNELDKLGSIDIDVDLNEEDLRAARDLLREQLDEIAKITLKVDDGDLDSARRAINDLDRELKKIREVEIDVHLDEDSLRDARQKLLDGLNDAYAKVRRVVDEQMKDIVISPDIDQTKVNKGLRDIEQKLERIEELKATITPELDDAARRKVEREIEALRDSVEDIKASIAPDLNAAAVLTTRARLAALARTRIVSLVPVVSNAAAARAGATLAALSGARVIHTYFDKISESIKNLDKNVPMIGSLALATSGLAGFALSASSNLFALSSSLAQIGPAALALPGIVGGIAIGVGVMVAALKDFHEIFPDVKQQFADMQDLISVNFWNGARESMREMLDVLLPQLSEGFGKTATALGGYFAGIADGIRNTLSEALGGMFDDLAASIDIATGGTGALVGIITTLGTVGAGYLPRLAQWFVDITTRFDEFLAKADADGRLQGWIETGIEMLGHLGSALESIGSILASISRAATAAGGAGLPSIAKTLERVAEVMKGENFQRGLIEVLEAAHDAMSIIALVSGPAVSNFFQELGSVISEILPIAGSAIGTLLREVANALSQPAFTGALIDLFTSLNNAIIALAPAFKPLGEVLTALGPVIGALAEVIGAALSAAIQALAPALVILLDAIKPLIPILGDALLQIITALAPVLEQVALAFANLVTTGIIPALTTAIAALLPVITELLPVIGEALITALDALAPVLPQLAEAFAEIVTAVAPLIPDVVELVAAVVPLIPLFVDLALMALPLVVDNIEKLVKAASTIITGLTAVLDFIFQDMVPGLIEFKDEAKRQWDELVDGWLAALDSVKGAWETFSGYFEVDWSSAWTSVKNKFVDIGREIEGKWNDYVADIKSEWTTFRDFFSKDWGRVWDDVKTKITTKLSEMWKAITTFFSDAKTEATTRLTEIKTSFSTAWAEINTLVSEAWAEIKRRATEAWAELVAEITSGVGQAVGKVGELPGRAVAALSSLASDLSGVAATAWVETVSAIGTGVTNAVAKVGELPGLAASALGGIRSTLKNAGVQLVQGFIDGIVSMFDAVQSALSRLTKMLPDWKGPASLDRVILVDAGKSVIGGFISGLESQYGAVKRSLRGLTADVARTAFMSPEIGLASGGSGARGLGRTVADATGGNSTTKTFNYYAAEGSSINSEEDLFAATKRGRFGGF